MKLQLIAVFGAGYVLGARAGRERYEEIKDAAVKISDDPRVKDATAKAETLVRDTATRVQDDPRVADATAKAEEKVKSATAAAQDKAKGASKKASKKASSASGTSNADADRPAGVPDASVPPLAEGQVPAAEPTLADDPLATADEVVYTSGPDVEESIDDLPAPSDENRT